MHAPLASRARRGATFAPAFAVALLAVLPFLPALSAGLFADDAILIRKGRVASPLALEYYFPGFYGFRPNVVPALLFSADAALHGERLAGYRATNLLLHGASAALLFLLARPLFGGRAAPALFAALLFAVHPARAEAVAWISGRQDLACALLLLLVLLLFARDRFRAAGSALLLALASKETAVLAPLLLLALDRALPEGDAAGRRRFLRFSSAASAAYLAIKFGLFGVDLAGHSHLGPGAVLKTLLLYPALFLFPPLSSFPQTISNLAPHHVAAVLAFLAAALHAARAGDRVARFGLLFAASTLLPVAHLLPIPDYVPHADRFLHVPAIGLSLAASALVFGASAAPGSPRARLAAPLSACLVAALALAAWDRSPLFGDYPVAVDAALEANPRNEAALFLTGRLLAPTDPSAAAARFRAALARAPYDNPFFHERLVAALAAANDLPGALSALREGFSRFPGHARLHFQAGRMLRGIGRTAEADAAFASAHAAAPRDVEILRALALLRGGTAAVELLSRARAINPWHYQTENNLAAAHLACGDTREALLAALRADERVRADPRASRDGRVVSTVRATLSSARAGTPRGAIPFEE